jgi:hypothetical protein
MAIWPVTTATSRGCTSPSRKGSSEVLLRLSQVANGHRVGMTDDVLDDELERDEAESDDTDENFDRAPPPGKVPAPERPLFDPDTDDGEDE